MAVLAADTTRDQAGVVGNLSFTFSPVMQGAR